MIKRLYITMMLGGLMAMTGCGALSKPAAAERLMGLNSYGASKGTTPQQFYSARYYADGKTPAQRLDEQFTQVDKSNPTNDMTQTNTPR
jgi:hypothetical protein